MIVDALVFLSFFSLEQPSTTYPRIIIFLLLVMMMCTRCVFTTRLSSLPTALISMSISLEAADEAVKEYLLFRGFVRSLQAFEAEQKSSLEFNMQVWVDGGVCVAVGRCSMDLYQWES